MNVDTFSSPMDKTKKKDQTSSQDSVLTLEAYLACIEILRILSAKTVLFLYAFTRAYIKVICEISNIHFPFTRLVL